MHSEMNDFAIPKMPVLEIYIMERKAPETENIHVRLFSAMLFIETKYWECLVFSSIA